MPAFSPQKALRDLVKTPVILNVVLRGVDQQQAVQARDGADGWSVLEILGHMNDYEAIFTERARLMLAGDNPALPGYDPNERVITNAYASQNLAEVFASYIARRREFVALLRALPAEQWLRTGIHRESGTMTIVELATNTTLHDVNHIEQIIKALGSSPDLVAL